MIGLVFALVFMIGCTDNKEADSENSNGTLTKQNIMDIANKTRQSDEILIGLSTRACLDIVKLAKARAFVMSRDYVIPEDVLDLSNLTMIHRIIFKNVQKIIDKEAILKSVLETVKNPL